MSAIERLFALEQFGIKLGLDNIRAILAALGNPERAYRSIHVAGTNGKGSVVAMVERGLRAAGLTTGRYTSPHLDRIEERVAINGRDVDAAAFESAVAAVFAAVDRASADGSLTVTPTFFEVSTAAAFEIFRRAAVDVAVVEVGLGGRFDATNVLTPVVSAITSIAFDHERHLGRTLSDIAFEKAGIAKPGVPLILGRMPAEAEQRIAHVAAAVGAPIVPADATSARAYPQYELALAGRHQLDNALVARAIMETWSNAIGLVSTDAIVAGLTDCEWPARLEWLRVPPNRELLIDAAHNPAGAAALASYLKDVRSEKLPIVFAAMADKDLPQMVAPLVDVASSFVATTIDHGRARPADRLAAEIRAQFAGPVEAVPSPEQAVRRALDTAARAVACGSIYMIGPLRARLLATGATRL